MVGKPPTGVVEPVASNVESALRWKSPAPRNCGSTCLLPLLPAPPEEKFDPKSFFTRAPLQERSKPEFPQTMLLLASTFDPVGGAPFSDKPPVVLAFAFVTVL